MIFLNIRKFTQLFDRKERYLLLLLLGFQAISAMFEAVGIASILPFMLVVSDPSKIESSLTLKFLFDGLGFTNTKNFIIFVGTSVLFLLINGAFFRALALYFQFRLATHLDLKLGIKLIQRYISLDYLKYKNYNSSDFVKNVLSESANTIMSGLVPALNIISQSFLLTSILIVLCFTSFQVTVFTISIIILIYFFVYRTLSRYLKNYGTLRFKANRERFKWLTELFENLKVLKVMQKQSILYSEFEKNASDWASAHAHAQFLAIAPRYLLEGIAFGGLVCAVLVSISVGLSIADILPKLSVFALAGYKLMPASHQIYAGISELRSSSPSIEKILREFEITSDTNHSDPMQKFVPGEDIEMVTLENISFQYPTAKSEILQNFSASFHRGSLYCLIGETGSGKSTLIDMMLGLIEPSSGKIIYTSADLQQVKLENLRIGYVPQEITLIDSDIVTNITLCSDENEIDYNLLDDVCKKSILDDFIHNRLDAGYNTLVGEGGTKLSGGQRQRIGIARALYAQPNLLVLDEATSALDEETETKFKLTLSELKHSMIIVMIAHRKSMIDHCDVKYEITTDTKISR